jgi:hypothetical protein
MTTPRFVPADLTELVESGVLMAVNELVLWPLGLALAWVRAENGSCVDLGIRQWEYEDGHRETIAMAEDAFTVTRREAFAAWASHRRALMPESERSGIDAIVAAFSRTPRVDSP